MDKDLSWLHWFLLVELHYFFRCFFLHALDRSKLLCRCLFDLFYTPEVTEERLFPRLADAGNIVELGMDRPLFPELPVVRDGEAVRLVPDPGDQVRPGARRREDDGIGFSGQEYPLELPLRPLIPAPGLGKADHVRLFPRSLPFKPTLTSVLSLRERRVKRAAFSLRGMMYTCKSASGAGHEGCVGCHAGPGFRD